MPPKPHRVLLDRVSGYADEAAAYMRRRRVSRRPFARLYYAGGRSRATTPADSVAGGELFVAAGRLIEVAGKRPKPVSGATELLDPTVAERVLARALANGGEFAEVFAERRGGLSTLAIDESRIESVQSGAEEGAGVRVRQRRHHLLRPRRRPRPRRPRAGRRRGGRGAARRPRRAAPAAAPWRPTPAADRAPPRGRPRRAQGGAAARARRARPRGRAARSSSRRLLRRGAARGHRRQLRRPASAATTAPGCGSAPRPSPAAASGSRPAPRRSAATAASSCSTTTRRDRRAGGAQGADPARRRPGPDRLDAGRGRRRLRRRPLPRDDRPRARGRPRPEGRQRLRRQARRAGRPAAAQRLRRRPPAGRVGERRDRRRGDADARRPW